MKYSYYILKDPYCSDMVPLKTTLPQNQLKEAIAYIALHFDDIVKKEFYCPRIISKFLNEYYPCEETTIDNKASLDKFHKIDICKEKNKYLANSYYFKESYAKKHNKHNVKNAIFNFIVSQTIQK